MFSQDNGMLDSYRVKLIEEMMRHEVLYDSTMPKLMPPKQYMPNFKLRVFFNVWLMDDKLLLPIVEPQHIVSSSHYIIAKAGSFGIQPYEIVMPTPYIISYLALYYTYRVAAMSRTLAVVPGSSDTMDAYWQKFKLYQSEVDRYDAMLTKEAFIGQAMPTKSAYPMSIPLYRN